jgi:lysophospholipase L1-like esterase
MDIKKIDLNMATNYLSVDRVNWIQVNNDNFVLKGGLFFKENKSFHRLPKTIETRPNLIALGKHSSGIYFDFKTNSTAISLKVDILSKAYMAHMAATGQNGFDLYFKNKGKWIFLATTKVNFESYALTLIKDLKPALREYRLYFPLYNEVKDIYLGIDEDASIKKIASKEERIVFYGTSITQGGCATRPGINYTSLLGRKLNLEAINFGFSGNCHLDKAMLDILKEIKNMKYLILEPESNLTNEMLEEKLPPFLKELKNSLKKTEIILISAFPQPVTLIKDEAKENYLKRKEFQKQLCLDLNVRFLDGFEILKKLNYEETVDGIHLTDLGFYNLYLYLNRYLRNLK